MVVPQLVVPPEGFHNGSLQQARERISKTRSYADCSTVMVVPAIKPIPPKVAMSWMGMMAPMNQKFTRICLENMEVGDAYNAAVEFILGNPELSTWKYMLTVETDNILPADALLKLIEDIESGPYDAVGALYWTKGEGGQPMCYGNPAVMPRNFVPWLPQPETVSPCNGLGMGCTLFRLEFLKKMPSPWFKTMQEVIPGQGARAFTQDLWHFEEAAKFGERVACSTRVLVAHYDYMADICW
jgi:hypothetical protein